MMGCGWSKLKRTMVGREKSCNNRWFERGRSESLLASACHATLERHNEYCMVHSALSKIVYYKLRDTRGILRGIDPRIEKDEWH